MSDIWYKIVPLGVTSPLFSLSLTQLILCNTQLFIKFLTKKV